MAEAVQELYLVYGGQLVDAKGDDYADPGGLDVRGVFEGYETAYEEWKRASFQTVDDALVRYRIVPLF